MIFALVKIFLKNILFFGSFSDNLKKGFKGILKNIGIILLVIYCLAVFVGLFILSTVNSYELYSSQSMQLMVPISSIFISMMIVLFFGFFTVATNYYSGSGEEQFLAMPLKPYEFFIAKFITNWITEAGLAAVLFLSSALVYGYYEHLLKNPLFYTGLVISAICIPVIAIFVIYTILILLLKFVFVFRNKKFLTGISIFFVLCFSFSYSLLNINIQRVNEQTAMNFVNNKVLVFISGLTTGNIYSIVSLLLITLLIIFGLLPLLAPLYVETISNFSYGKTKKLTKTENEQVISKSIKAQNPFWALFWRDVKSVLREPAFFVNGPMLLFIFPVIFIISFGVSFFASGSFDIAQVISEINQYINMMDSKEIQVISKFIIVFSSFYTIFAGNSVSIALTAFSREGKFLPTLKAMPIDNSVLFKAKFFHAFTYCLIAEIITALILTLVYVLLGCPLEFAVFCKVQLWSFLISIAGLVFISFADIFFDVLNPKLMWENPSACFKQNMNFLFSIFILLVLCLIIFVLGIFIPGDLGLYVLLFVLVVLTAVMGNLFTRFILRKLKEL